jgi:hypothetical protein
MNLPALARAVRDHPGLRGKRQLAAVAATLGGDGDDAAVLPDGDGHLVLAAEAIWPPFVAARPRAAGVAGVVTVLNDLAATGARPLALLDCLVAGSRRLAEEVLEGLRVGAELYGVRVVAVTPPWRTPPRRACPRSRWAGRARRSPPATPIRATPWCWPAAWRGR